MSDHSPVIHQIMKLRYQAKRLCISLKMIQILPHLRGQDFIQRFTMIFQCMKMISEPLPDRIFSKMSKRRLPMSWISPAHCSTLQISSFICTVNDGSFLYVRMFSPIFCPRDLANEDTSRECVSLVRIKSLLSSGNTCVLSCNLRKDALPIIRW